MAKILCVDDEPNIVTLKCAILEAAGHQVTPSTSAHDAIEKLAQNTYDAVVTDWRLGDANGRSIVQAAKTHSTMPVVVVSGYVAEAFQAAEPLADLYLEKQVNPEAEGDGSHRIGAAEDAKGTGVDKRLERRELIVSANLAPMSLSVNGIRPPCLNQLSNK